MSDSESVPPASHPTTGGKTLQSIERPRYKSWRKKYRKIRHIFDGVLEDNKRLFKEEQKLEWTAKRLREELDGLLDLCLELNQNQAIPPELRFDVSHRFHTPTVSIVPPDITPEQADTLHMEYNNAVRTGQIPQIDLHVVRQQIDDRLAAQEVESLDTLEKSVAHAIGGEVPEDLKVDEPAGFLTLEQEMDYITRLDAKLDNTYNMVSSSSNNPEQEEKHWAELTPREFERRMELLNPQSQHNWLKMHAKGNPPNMGPEGMDDNESLASHDNSAGKPAVARKRSDKSKTLAKQVGDRALERAREGWSPSAASGMEEDEYAGDDAFGSGKKRGRDPDGTYRLKGGKSGGSGKGKRKRSGEDVGGLELGGGKKAKLEGE